MIGITDILLNVAMFFMLLSVLNLVRYMVKIRQLMKEHKDNPNVRGFSIVNGKVSVIEDKKTFSQTPEVKIEEETVVDLNCGKEITKKEAYRVIKEGREYFFCSWECRETFLEEWPLEKKTLV